MEERTVPVMLEVTDADTRAHPDVLVKKDGYGNNIATFVRPSVASDGFRARRDASLESASLESAIVTFLQVR